MSEDSLILRCSCSELSHAIRIAVWDVSNGEPNSFSLEVCTTGNGHGFWRRVRTAFAHVFNRSEIVYGDVVLSVEDASRLAAWVGRNLTKEGEAQP